MAAMELGDIGDVASAVAFPLDLGLVPVFTVLVPPLRLL